MSNMSYCKFRNTNKDLMDCEETLENLLYGGEEALRPEELEAAKSLVERCWNILGLIANSEALDTHAMIEKHDHDPTGFINKTLDKMNDEAYNEEDEQCYA